ncbi:sporulation membrane protein YtrI [Ornithinibacillus salinisoli]|uniref:Sporulation membrane protein YtrI n=1 Tax=Ornithinibacillus salinisoli TaxID=1848459 RepID=A0ABW4W518_9BACI
MHIPPYHKKPGWQRFLAGVFFGALISYFVLIFMYATMYERLLEENSNIRSELTEAKNYIKALEEDKQNLDEKSKQPITVESIELEITNAEQLRIDKLLLVQLEDLMKEEIKHIIGQDVNTVYESNQLLEATIENKDFKVDDFIYTFEIKRLLINKKVKISAEAKISN